MVLQLSFIYYNFCIYKSKGFKSLIQRFPFHSHSLLSNYNVNKRWKLFLVIHAFFILYKILCLTSLSPKCSNSVSLFLALTKSFFFFFFENRILLLRPVRKDNRHRNKNKRRKVDVLNLLLILILCPKYYKKCWHSKPNIGLGHSYRRKLIFRKNYDLTCVCVCNVLYMIEWGNHR